MMKTRINENRRYFNHELLDQLIEEKGYTKKYVAENLEVTKGLISQWTRNKHPSIPLYCELCEFLEIEYDILLRRKIGK